MSKDKTSKPSQARPPIVSVSFSETAKFKNRDSIVCIDKLTSAYIDLVQAVNDSPELARTLLKQLSK